MNVKILEFHIRKLANFAARGGMVGKKNLKRIRTSVDWSQYPSSDPGKRGGRDVV